MKLCLCHCIHLSKMISCVFFSFLFYIVFNWMWDLEILTWEEKIGLPTIFKLCMVLGMSLHKQCQMISRYFFLFPFLIESETLRNLFTRVFKFSSNLFGTMEDMVISISRASALQYCSAHASHHMLSKEFASFLVSSSRALTQTRPSFSVLRRNNIAYATSCRQLVCYQNI